MHFKNDGASPHFLCEVRNFCNDNFPGWSIRCEFSHSWPAKSSGCSPPISCMGMCEKNCLEYEVWNAMCIAGSHSGCNGLDQKQSLGSEHCLLFTAKWQGMLLLRVGFFKSESLSMKGSFMKLNLEFKFISSVFVYYLFCILLASEQFSWCLNLSTCLVDNETEIMQHVL